MLSSREGLPAPPHVKTPPGELLAGTHGPAELQGGFPLAPSLGPTAQLQTLGALGAGTQAQPAGKEAFDIQMRAPNPSVCEGAGCRARAGPAKVQHGEHRAAVCTLRRWGSALGWEEQDEAQTPAESCERCGIIQTWGSSKSHCTGCTAIPAQN